MSAEFGENDNEKITEKESQLKRWYVQVCNIQGKKNTKMSKS